MGRGRRPVAELAKAYLQHYRTSADADFWAFEEVQKRIVFDSAEPDDAWRLVLALVELADEDSLGYISAGPLEDFVCHFGTDSIEYIETEARRNPKFRSSLGRIWLSRNDLSADVLARVVQASNGQIRPFES